MLRKTPYSLYFIVAVPIFVVLQMVPPVSMFQLILLPFSSLVLINLGMIGTAIEALARPYLRQWILLPAIYYGGYWMIVAVEQIQISNLKNALETANAEVALDFDANNQDLVFEDRREAAWLVQNFGIEKVYFANPAYPDGYGLYRLAGDAACKLVDANRRLYVHANIQISTVYVNNPSEQERNVDGICLLSMPQKPSKNFLEIKNINTNIVEKTINFGFLQINQVDTEIKIPDGQAYRILSGQSDPLFIFPLLGIGFDNFFTGRFFFEFMRVPRTQILSGKSKHHRETEAIATALGLVSAEPKLRGQFESEVLSAQISDAFETALSAHLRQIDDMISDPVTAKPLESPNVVASRPAVLTSKADAIVDALEKAAKSQGKNSGRTSSNGKAFAGLIAALPQRGLSKYEDRIISLYSAVDKDHWLWSYSPLIRELGRLGVPAIPVLSQEQLWTTRKPAGDAPFEAACMIGAAGRMVLEPLLLTAWANEGSGLDQEEIFVALRRMGVNPPPLDEDTGDSYRRLTSRWGDIGPQSPIHVCDVSTEGWARKTRAIEAGRADW